MQASGGISKIPRIKAEDCEAWVLDLGSAWKKGVMDDFKLSSQSTQHCLVVMVMEQYREIAGTIGSSQESSR